MTEKELLELAAKAAKMTDWEWVDSWSAMAQKRDAGGFYFDSHWNPLTNDGDALRLTVRLRLRVECRDDGHAYICKDDRLICNEFALNENSFNELCAATRRAIVRAAAEIGRSMK